MTDFPILWGWTDGLGGWGLRECVFPTHVGMDQARPGSGLYRSWVFPTQVGMDRSMELTGPTSPLYSRRMWGWTDFRQMGAERFSNIPHARGDGPDVKETTSYCMKVFPTHVGMDRRLATCFQPSPTIPHARGDEPPDKAGEWICGFEFPTHVGMDLRKALLHPGINRIPHT